MDKHDKENIKAVIKKVAEIQAPTDIDPNNLDLNGSEVSEELSEKDIHTIEKLENIIENIRITKLGRIHKQDKKVLNSAGLEVIETYNPEQPDRVMIKAKIPTTEEKSMPDNYDTHTITVVRNIED
jgi:hypothetical protein